MVTLLPFLASHCLLGSAECLSENGSTGANNLDGTSHPQDYLARICIPQTEHSTYYKYKKKYNLTDHCGYKEEPLWPVSVQHETHFFIFAVAVTHITYCAVTIALTLHKVGTWRKWEDEAIEEAKSSANTGDVKVMQETVSRSLIRSMCTAALATISGHRSPLDVFAHAKALFVSLLAQFRVSVSHPMYHNVRLMFIEKMGLAYDFDYHALVTNGMESQLAHAVHASWPLWLIAIIFLVLPSPSYVPYWSYILVILLMLVVGAKLVSVTALLGMQMAIKYGDSVLFGRMDADPKALKRTAPKRRMSLSRLADAITDAPDATGGGAIVIGGGVMGGGEADGGGAGGGGDEDGGGGGGGKAAAGAHVLDEALPADVAVEVQAQVAAVTALTSRQEALAMLRTLALMPLLPEPTPPPAPEAPAETRVEPVEGGTAAAAAAGGGVLSGASTPTLLPSPSLLLAPPRWDAGAPSKKVVIQEEARPPGLVPDIPSPAGGAAGAGVAAGATSGELPSRPSDAPPSGDIAITVRPEGGPTPDAAAKGPGSRPTSAAAGKAPGGSRPVSAAPGVPKAPGSRPVSAAPPAGQAGRPATPPSTLITSMGRPASAARQPGDLAAAAAAASPVGVNGLLPSPGFGSSGLSPRPLPPPSDILSASLRPGTAGLRPSTASLRPGTSSGRPVTPGGGGGDAAGVTLVRPVSALRPTPSRPGSKSLLAVGAATTWANASRRQTAGLMLAGVASSRATFALAQMEQDAAAMAAAAETQPAAAPGGGEAADAATTPSAARPTSPAPGAGGLRTLMASIRMSRKARESEESRRLLDSPMPRADGAAGPTSPPSGQTDATGATLIRVAPAGGAPAAEPPAAAAAAPAAVMVLPGVPADAEVGQATLKAAAAAAALARKAAEWPPKKPIRRCMSARTLWKTPRIGEDDEPTNLATTFVRKPGLSGADTTGNNATGGAGGGGRAADDARLGIGMDLMLPASNFARQPRPSQGPVSPTDGQSGGLKFPNFGALAFWAKKDKKDKKKEGEEEGVGSPGLVSPASPAPAPAPAVETPPPPPPPPPPPLPPAHASVFAAYQLQPQRTEKPPAQQQQEAPPADAASGPSMVDWLSIYDSLAGLLPPGTERLASWGLPAASASAEKSAAAPSAAPEAAAGAAATAPPADGEVAVAKDVATERDGEEPPQAAECAENRPSTPAPAADASSQQQQPPPSPDFSMQAQPQSGEGAPSSRPATPTLLAQPPPPPLQPQPSQPVPPPPHPPRPQSGLRVVRFGDDGEWLTLEEAAALAARGFTSVSPAATTTAAVTGGAAADSGGASTREGTADGTNTITSVVVVSEPPAPGEVVLDPVALAAVVPAPPPPAPPVLDTDMDRMSSVALPPSQSVSRPGSVAPGSRPVSAAPGSRPGSVAPGSRPGSVGPGSRPGTVGAGSRPGSVTPSGSRPLNPTLSSAFLEAPAWEAPMPVPSGAELPPQPSSSSVFSVSSVTRADALPPVGTAASPAAAEPWPTDPSWHGIEGDVTLPPADSGIRAAASVEGSGELILPPALSGLDETDDFGTSLGLSAGSTTLARGFGAGGEVQAAAAAEDESSPVPARQEQEPEPEPEMPPALQVVTARAEAVLPEPPLTPSSLPTSPTAPAEEEEGEEEGGNTAFVRQPSARGGDDIVGEETAPYDTRAAAVDAAAERDDDMTPPAQQAGDDEFGSVVIARDVAEAEEQDQEQEQEVQEFIVQPGEAAAAPTVTDGSFADDEEPAGGPAADPEAFEASPDLEPPPGYRAGTATATTIAASEGPAGLEETFSGFNAGSDLNRTASRVGAGTGLLPEYNRTAPRIPGGAFLRPLSSTSSSGGGGGGVGGGGGDPPSPELLQQQQPSRAGSALGGQMRAHGSTASLMSLAPWGGEAGGVGGGGEVVSDPPSRQDSTSGAVRSREASTTSGSGVARPSNSGGGSRHGVAPVSEDVAAVPLSLSRGSSLASREPMPPPPPAPLAPPPAPPPPDHLRLQVLGEHCGDTVPPQGAAAGEPVARGGRWAEAVPTSSSGGFRAQPGQAQPPNLRQISTASSAAPDECIVERFDDDSCSAAVPPGAGTPVSVRSWDDVASRPVCEGSDGIGREDVLAPTRSSSNRRQGTMTAGAGAADAAPPAAAAAADGAAAGGAQAAASPPAAGTATAGAAPGGAAPGHGVICVEGVHAGAKWVGLTAKRKHKAEARQHIERHLKKHQQGEVGERDSDSDGDGGRGRKRSWWPWRRGGRKTSGDGAEAAAGGASGNRVVPLAGFTDHLGVKAKMAMAPYAEGVKEKMKEQHQPIQRKMSDHWLERVRGVLAAHKGFENMDAAVFFWFHKPKVIAYIFNWAYYENSLSIALLVFSLILGYQEKWVFKGSPVWAVPVLLVADVLILVHSCLYVLPLYALIMPVGAHCPKDVLRRALKSGMYTRQTALIAKAMHLQLKSRDVDVKEPPPSFFYRVRHWKPPKKEHVPPTAAMAASAFVRAGVAPAAGGAGAGSLSPGRAGGLSPGTGSAFSPGSTGAFSPAARDADNAPGGWVSFDRDEGARAAASTGRPSGAEEGLASPQDSWPPNRAEGNTAARSSGEAANRGDGWDSDDGRPATAQAPAGPGAGVGVGAARADGRGSAASSRASSANGGDRSTPTPLLIPASGYSGDISHVATVTAPPLHPQQPTIPIASAVRASPFAAAPALDAEPSASDVGRAAAPASMDPAPASMDPAPSGPATLGLAPPPKAISSERLTGPPLVPPVKSAPLVPSRGPSGSGAAPSSLPPPHLPPPHPPRPVHPPAGHPTAPKPPLHPPAPPAPAAAAPVKKLPAASPAKPMATQAKPLAPASETDEEEVNVAAPSNLVAKPSVTSADDDVAAAAPKPAPKPAAPKPAPKPAAKPAAPKPAAADDTAAALASAAAAKPAATASPAKSTSGGPAAPAAARSPSPAKQAAPAAAGAAKPAAGAAAGTTASPAKPAAAKPAAAAVGVKPAAAAAAKPAAAGAAHPPAAHPPAAGAGHPPAAAAAAAAKPAAAAHPPAAAAGKPAAAGAAGAAKPKAAAAAKPAAAAAAGTSTAAAAKPGAAKPAAKPAAGKAAAAPGAKPAAAKPRAAAAAHDAHPLSDAEGAAHPPGAPKRRVVRPPPPPPPPPPEDFGDSLEIEMERAARGRKKRRSSSSGSSAGSMDALFAGMLRGAMTHLTPEERAAAANARFAARGHGGRGGLDMTFVPER